MEMRDMTPEEYAVLVYADSMGLNVPDFVDVGDDDKCRRPVDITPEENAAWSQLVNLYLLHYQEQRLKELIEVQDDQLALVSSIKGWVTFFGVLAVISLVLGVLGLIL